MNLYLLSQNTHNGYDTFDSMVVAAEDEASARLIHPEGDEGYNGDSIWATPYSAWCRTPEMVKVEYLGIAKEGTKSGEILSSFNAG